MIFWSDVRDERIYKYVRVVMLVDVVSQLMRKTNIFNILSFSKICLWFPSYFEFSSCKKTYIDIVRWWDRENLQSFTMNRKYKKDKINIFCIEFDISDWEEEIEDDWSHSAICHPTLYQQTSVSASNIYLHLSLSCELTMGSYLNLPLQSAWDLWNNQQLCRILKIYDLNWCSV